MEQKILIGLSTLTLIVTILVGFFVVDLASKSNTLMEKNLELIEKTNFLTSQIYNSTNYEPLVVPREGVIDINPMRGGMYFSAENSVILIDYAGRHDLEIKIINATLMEWYIDKECFPYTHTPTIIKISGHTFASGNGVSTIKMPINLKITYPLKQEYFQFRSNEEKAPLTSMELVLEINNMNTNKKSFVGVEQTLNMPFNHKILGHVSECYLEDYS